MVAATYAASKSAPSLGTKLSKTAQLVALFALGGALGSQALAQELPKLDIGAVLPLTGSQAPYGQEMLKGMTLAVEQLMAAEPKLSGKLQLLTGDEKSQPSEAANAATQLIEKQHADVLIGSVASPSTIAVATVARKLQKPLLSPLSTARSIANGGYVYRLSLDDANQGAMLAEFAFSHLKQTNAAILRDDTDGALAAAGAFSNSFQAKGGKIVATEIYDLASDDFSAPLTRLRDKQVTLIMLPAYYQTAAQVMQQAKKLKMQVVFLGNDSWDTPDLQKLGGAATQGNFFTAQFAADDPDPVTVAFVAAFKTKYKRDPGVIAALGFDSVLLAVSTMRHANSNLPNALTKTLDRTQGFLGASGVISYMTQGEMIKSATIKEAKEKNSVFNTRIGAATAAAPSPAAATAPQINQIKGH